MLSVPQAGESQLSHPNSPCTPQTQPFPTTHRAHFTPAAQPYLGQRGHPAPSTHPWEKRKILPVAKTPPCLFTLPPPPCHQQVMSLTTSTCARAGQGLRALPPPGFVEISHRFAAAVAGACRSPEHPRIMCDLQLEGMHNNHPVQLPPSLPPLPHANPNISTFLAALRLRCFGLQLPLHTGRIPVCTGMWPRDPVCPVPFRSGQTFP